MNPQKTLPVNKIVFTEKEIKNITQHLKAADLPEISLYCTLCCKNPRDYLNLTCYHLVSCEECGKKLQKCPQCPAKMQGKKIFV